MSDYNRTAERLWELMEQSPREEWDTSCVDLKQPFPIDQFEKKNPRIRTLIKRVQREFRYELSEFQCSWAVVSFMRMPGGFPAYQKKHGLAASR